MNIGKAEVRYIYLPDPLHKTRPVMSIRHTTRGKRFDRTHFCTIKAHGKYATNVSSNEVGNKSSRLAVPHLDTEVIATTNYKIGTQGDIAN